MQTKSNIQLLREQMLLKETFKNAIADLMESYTIEDNFFTMREDGYMKEETTGYFNSSSTYTKLDEAVSAMSKGQVVRVINNERFEVGNIYKKLSDVKEGSVYDIATGRVIE